VPKAARFVLRVRRSRGDREPSAAAAMRRWIFILILLGWGNGNHEKLRGTATLEDVQPLANLLGIRPCQRNPFPRALIPGSGGRVVGRHVIEADASEHQKLDFPRDAADLELADIEIRKAAV